MKVICKRHKTCKDRVNCYHSNPHNLTSGWSGMNFMYNCNIHLLNNSCECGEDHLIKHLRKQKLKKLNESNL